MKSLSSNIRQDVKIYSRSRVIAFLISISLIIALTSGCGVVQYNMCGNVCDSKGENDVINFIKGGGRPLAITLNEVCKSQYDKMLDALDDYGYRGSFNITKPLGCQPNSIFLLRNDFGNAIFYLGEHIENYYLRYRAQNSDKEIRKAMCIKAKLGDSIYLVCVTHLENNEGYAEKQADELLQWIKELRSGMGFPPTIVGGDFNLTPDNEVMKKWYATFSEVDGSRHQWTHKSEYCVVYCFSKTKKIDYIFYRGLTRKGEAIVEDGAGGSDHRGLFGHITLP